ncbi:MAG: hypothetical protein HC889_13715 [Synechococcaceae cyanobacterium SM1_2_3]|nr:hypothetical protein [Synechococcaceae cyanobacterium SM1_2_3]
MDAKGHLSELRQLDNVMDNWVAWDDAFADNRNPTFIQSNQGDWRVLFLDLCRFKEVSAFAIPFNSSYPRKRVSTLYQRLTGFPPAHGNDGKRKSWKPTILQGQDAGGRARR